MQSNSVSTVKIQKRVIICFPFLHAFHAVIQIFRACNKLRSPPGHFIYYIFFPIWYEELCISKFLEVIGGQVEVDYSLKGQLLQSAVILWILLFRSLRSKRFCVVFERFFVHNQNLEIGFNTQKPHRNACSAGYLFHVCAVLPVIQVLKYLLLQQRWLCSKILSLLVFVENIEWVGSKSQHET